MPQCACWIWLPSVSRTQKGARSGKRDAPTGGGKTRPTGNREIPGSLSGGQSRAGQSGHRGCALMTRRDGPVISVASQTSAAETAIARSRQRARPSMATRDSA
jgi:hypothetical protein